MPDPREIERLKKIVRALANEDEVLSARGDAYTELPPPPESSASRGASQVRQRLEQESENVTGHFTDIPEPSSPESEAAPDFSSLLQDMDFSMPDTADAGQEGEALPEEAESTGIPEVEEPSGFEDFDLGAFVEQQGDESGMEMPNGEEAANDGEALSGVEAQSAEEAQSADFGTILESIGQASSEVPSFEVPGSANEGISAEDPQPQEELFADEGLSQAEMAQAMKAFSEPEETPEEIVPESAEKGIPAEIDSGAFDIPAFEVGEMGGADESGSAMDLGGEASVEETPPPVFNAGIQARVDLEPPPRAPVGQKAPESAKAEEDPFASFNFDDGGLLGGTTPAAQSIDSGFAALNQGSDAGEGLGDESAWGGAASFGEFGSQSAFERKSGPEAEKAEDKGISLTEKEVDRLQDSLLSYPLNLRLEIEQCIANDVLPPQQTAELIKALVEGKNAPETAALLGRFLGKRIPVPKGFEKRTGEQFEAERGTFWYAFKTNILPLVGIVAAILGVLAMTVFLGYNLVWKPLYADSIYRSGYKLIPEGDYKQAEILFDTAVKVRNVRGWYFRYAESYIKRKQYTLAEKKYDELLYRRSKNGAFDYRHYNKDKKAAIDYARFESKTLLAYEKAERLLKTTILDWKPNDADALLLMGDNYLAWAEDLRQAEARAEKLEGARTSFAGLIRLYGRRDLYLGRMLVYFIRTDNKKEVILLKDIFLAKKKPVIDSAIYAELGAYLIDANNLEEVRDILFLGVKREPSLPDNHYQLARYFRLTGNPDEEGKALMRAKDGYENYLPGLNVGLSRNRLMAYIDTLNWSGDHAYAAKRFLDAEEFYNSAIKAYTDALDKKRIEVSGRFGEIYANLADIYYYDRARYETAFSLYQEAEKNEYTTPETAYKRGFIKYREAAYKDALVFFYQASGDFTVSDNLLLSLANTLYYRMDYSAASGYYLQLRDAMRDEIDRALYKEPQDRPDESRLVRLLMTASNNLGVSLYYLANRGGDASRRAEAMASFTESLRLYDVMNRDQSTMLRPQGANLAFLNLDGILHPSRLFVPQIYPDISRDLVDSDEKIARDAALYVGKQR